MDIDDLKNPEYRKGRHNQLKRTWPGVLLRPALTEVERRARFATQAARAEFGRFYWNDDLARRMRRHLKASLRLKREQANQARRRKDNGGRR